MPARVWVDNGIRSIPMRRFAIEQKGGKLGMTNISTNRELVDKYGHILTMVCNVTIKKNESDPYVQK